MLQLDLDDRCGPHTDSSKQWQHQLRALHAAHHGSGHARASVDGIVTAS